jgi:electron transport complex protein RnfD
MSKPKGYSWMTKDELMTYTFIALSILTAVSALSFGVTSLIIAAISVTVAVAVDYLFSKVSAKSRLNTMSAAVFGLIVALSYSLGLPPEITEVQPITMMEPGVYIFPALISMIGIVLFKKLQGLLGRKYVNPAAAAKLLVLIPLLSTALMPADHTKLPSLTSPLYYDKPSAADNTVPFGVFLQACYGGVPLATITSPSDVLGTLAILKLHGWVGGVSSVAVIAVGLVLFVLCRGYIKWRITLVYLITTALFALGLNFVYGGDPSLRIAYHLFIGSSIFMAFFMATDPATTPLTYWGQAIFGAGLGILSMVFQVYMNFLGGSIAALVLMNLTSPLLDNVGKLRPRTEKITPKLPRAKEFETVRITECLRCGACMRSCCHNLSPILVKQAFEKGNLEAARKLQANLCDGCGHCSFVCPARIDLKGTILKTKSALRNVENFQAS